MVYFRILFLLATVYLCSCSPLATRYVTTNSLPKANNIAVIVVDNGQFVDSRKAFGEEFGQSQGYGDVIGKLIAAKLKESVPCEQVDISFDDQKILALKIKVSGKYQNEIRTVLEKLDPKFDQVLVLHKWKIQKKKRSSYVDTCEVNSIHCKLELTGGLLNRDGTILEYGKVEHSYSVGLPHSSSAIKSGAKEVSFSLVDLLTHKMANWKIQDL